MIRNNGILARKGYISNPREKKVLKKQRQER